MYSINSNRLIAETFIMSCVYFNTFQNKGKENQIDFFSKHDSLEVLICCNFAFIEHYRKFKRLILIINREMKKYFKAS